MPLTRLNDEAFAEELEGVSFGMMTDKGATVPCFVSHEALTDKARTAGQGGMLEAFHEYRSEIEDIASAQIRRREHRNRWPCRRNLSRPQSRAVGLSLR
jgi:Protein of unknown function (DUF1488)